MAANIALGVDTGMTVTGLVAHTDTGEEFMRSIRRPGRGNVGVPLMIGRVRAAVADATAASTELLVVATERLVHMRGPSEHNLALQWAVVEASLAALRHDTGPARVVICLPMPSQLKKFVTGDGGAEKAVVGRFIERHWPQAPTQEDAAEAYALMQFALCRRQCELGEITRKDHGPWTRYQIDLVTRDLWSRAQAGNLLTIAATRQALELCDEAFPSVQRWWQPIRSSAEAIT